MVVVFEDDLLVKRKYPNYKKSMGATIPGLSIPGQLDLMGGSMYNSRGDDSHVPSNAFLFVDSSPFLFVDSSFFTFVS